MRDLGLMGESAFRHWCAEAGLTANGSQVDKTGWDFFVEFPFSPGLSTHEIHKSALECRVQIKATDHKHRKLPVSLSNLRRFITAQMPTFFVFIEFDGKNSAQRAFVVHVDNNLISKTLKKLHQLEQSGTAKSLNKRTMTIHYDDSSLLKKPNGEFLRNAMESHIGENISDYIARKKTHLESTGYEHGFGQITFTIEGEDNLKALIDASLGLEKQVDISKFRGIDTRFEIPSKTPFSEAEGGKLEIPNLQPTSYGTIRFREDKLTPGLSFNAKLYNSPFNFMAPDNLKKIRIEGDFFDLLFNPYTGAASYSFSFKEEARLEIKKFRDAIKLINLLGSSGRKLFIELLFDNFSRLEFNAGSREQGIDFSREINALDCAINLILEFDISETIDISLNEISRHKSQICHFHDILSKHPGLFKVEFGVNEDSFDPENQTACIFLVTAPIGSHIFGAILVLTGFVTKTENKRFILSTANLNIEKRIVSRSHEVIPEEELIAAIEKIEDKYDVDFSVVNMCRESGLA